MYIENINGPEDVKKLSEDQLNVLAEEIRDALLKKLSKHGGHFGPNFGMVEATIAMHYVFESPKDKIVYDVSHQSYPHKMLTGRKDAFLYEEHYDDVSGYSNPGESEHDHFTIGHTSTSISLALGLAKARDLKEENGNVIAVIGDGSLSGGEALEGLDYAAELGGNLIIVVNDNDMSIAENHGGLYENLKALRETNGESKCNLFKAMGLDYIYVKEGNKVADLIEAFKQVKDTKKAVVVHINTQKGKGYKLAEEHKEDWHYCAPFDVETGKPLDSFDGEDFSSVTAQYLLKKMKEDKKVVAITSATPTVMGFTEDKRKEAGRQFIDVGIAEEHAVSFAAGLALGGVVPVVAIYSSFLQRAVDQMLHDVCMQKLHVIFAVDRAGLVGADGETHQGNFDISYLSMMPGMTVMAPKNDWELKEMLRFAVKADGPVAIRYPRGNAYQGLQEYQTAVEMGKSEVLHSGCKVAVLALGSMVEICAEVCSELQKEGIDSTFVNVRFVKPLDTALLDQLARNHSLVVTVEENVQNGGFGQQVCGYMEEHHPGIQVLPVAIPDRFVPHGGVDSLRVQLGLSANAIAEKIKKISGNYSEGIRE